MASKSDSLSVVEVEKQWSVKKKLYGQVKLSALPDGGAKLKQQIENLETLLQSLTLKKDEMRCSSNKSQYDEKGDRSFRDGKIEIIRNELPCGYTKSEARKDGSLQNGAITKKSLEGQQKHKDEKSSNDHRIVTKSEARKDESPQNRAITKKSLEGQQKHKNEKSSNDHLNDRSSMKGGTQKIFTDQSSKMVLIQDQLLCTKKASSKLNKCLADDKLNKRKTALEVESKGSSPVNSAETKGAAENGSCSELLSFSDLSKRAPSSTLASNFLDSPSFKEYRQSGASSKGIQLTEALPLSARELGVSVKGSLKSVGTMFNYVHQTNLMSIAASIHGSLKSCPLETDEELDPPQLKTNLMKHQKQALAWLLWRESQIPSGGIFADDMGLGKTLTMISLVLKTKKVEEQSDELHGGTLIVCPASLIRQWNNEIDKHCHNQAMKVLMYQGTNRPRDANIIAKYDAVICSFDLLRGEGQSMKNKAPLLTIRWNRVILDEAHVIKNHKTVTAQWIYNLRSNHRWAVSGTPIHNDLADIYSLLKFLQCTPFDDHKVWKKLITDYSENSVKRRNALLKGILYRRSKDQVDENGEPLVKLPKKHIYIYKLVLSETERKLYQTVYSKSRQKIVTHEQKSMISKTNSPPSSSSELLLLLLRLQQCCNHPALLGQSAMDDSVDHSVADLSSTLSFLTIDNTTSCPSQDNALDLTYDESLSIFPSTKSSSKIDKLLRKLKRILKESSGKDKSVIVSQWVTMLDIVAGHLEENDIQYHMIKGGLKPEALANIIEDFNFNSCGAPVILLSLKAGGVGLNLVGGNHMFLLDLHWNPALEMQVCDRIYRVGQTKEVFIHKFMCLKTIEEKIVDLQSEKKRLASRVLNGAKTLRDHLSYDDIRDLFNL